MIIIIIISPHSKSLLELQLYYSFTCMYEMEEKDSKIDLFLDVLLDMITLISFALDEDGAKFAIHTRKALVQ